MKIIIITNGMFSLPNINGGAIEELIQNFIDINEIRQEFEITVACKYDKESALLASKYDKTKFLYYSKFNSYNLLTILFIVIYRFFALFKISVPKYLYSWEILRVANQENFDFFIVEEGDCFSFDYFSKKFGRNKMISHTHSSWPINEKFYKIYGTCIVPSNFTKKTLVGEKYAHYSNHIKVVKNCIDIRKFGDIDKVKLNEIKNKLLDNSKKTLLYLGRIAPDKGVLELIEAMDELEGYQLVIVGSALLSKKTNTIYEKKIKQCLQGNKNIHVTGYIQYNELKYYYEISDVVVVPSYAKESACMVNIEAMVMGKVIVTTNDGGIPEYVTGDENGILIEIDDLSRNIVKAIQILENNQKIVNQIQNNNMLKSKSFSPERYYDEIHDILKQELRYMN